MTSRTVTTEQDTATFAPHLKELAELGYINRYKIIAVTGVILFITALLHYLYPSYSVTSYLIINSQSESSNLQGFLSSMGGGAMDRGGLGDAEDSKFMMKLQSSSFARKFAEEVQQAKEFPVMVKLINQHRGLMPHLRYLMNSPFRKTPFDPNTPPKTITPAKLTLKRKGVIEIEFRTVDPKLTVFLTNQYLDSAVRLFTEQENAKIDTAREYIQNKIKDTLAKLESTDQRILELNQKGANVSLLAPKNAIGEQLLKLREELQAAKFKLEQNIRVIETLSGKEHSTSANEVASPSSSPFGIGRTITNLETENRILKIRIDTLEKGLKGYLKFNLSLPKEEQKMSELSRQKGLDFYVFDNLFKTMLNIEVQGLSVLSRVRPLEKVTIDEVGRPFGISSKLMLMLMAGVFGTWAVLYFLKLLNPVIRTRNDFEAPGVSFLGNVPKIDPTYFERFRSAYPSLCNFQIDSKETIAFRQLRSRLIHLSASSGSKQRQVVSFLSYGSGDGKSFLSSNLAACIGHSGKRTLLVDFDVRRALLSRVFHLGNENGICEYLDKNIPLMSVIKHNLLPNLDMLPAGKVSEYTMERFSNQRFQEMLHTLTPNYDFIIIDTAPLLVAHESLAIAQEADFAVVVATSWQTKKQDLTEAVDRIQSVRKTHTHFIVNKTKEMKDSVLKNYYYVIGDKNPPTLRKEEGVTKAPSPIPPPLLVSQKNTPQERPLDS